jgi:hypothetical protein
MVGLPCLVSQCVKLNVAGGGGQFSHAFSGEVYDFYSVSPEYIGYTLVCLIRTRDSYDLNSRIVPLSWQFLLLESVLLVLLGSGR